MQQHTIHIAGGVVRNPLVRLTEPVTLDFLAGEHIAIVGPNGAGKTTAIRIITGLLKADEGTVMIGGKDAFLYSGQVKNEFGYVPDEFGLTTT